jgi:hypothetical protein
MKGKKKCTTIWPKRHVCRRLGPFLPVYGVKVVVEGAKEEGGVGAWYRLYTYKNISRNKKKKEKTYRNAPFAGVKVVVEGGKEEGGWCRCMVPSLSYSTCTKH